MSAISTLLALAFHKARAEQGNLLETWVKIGTRVGRYLPNSLLLLNVQQHGELDVLLRSMEQETALEIKKGELATLSLNYQIILSSFWIGGFYEILRLLKCRQLLPHDQTFLNLLKDFELLRIPLEKHEIAKDRRRLEGALELVKYPSSDINHDKYVYDPKDKTKAHIMPSGVSERGSIMWQVVDAEQRRSYWIERLSLSDRIIEFWGERNNRGAE